ncbi:MAG: indolepyruvate oxidoreductase subunit beta [Solirubrobacterales bacterium]
MAKQTTDILIVGVGGQGALLAGRILADAAIRLGKDVKVSEIHGMAQRGGSVVAQVRYGDKVYSPIIKKGDADVVMAFEKLEAARYLDFLKADGLMVINSERIDPAPVMSGEAKYPDDVEAKIAAAVPRTRIADATKIASGLGNVKAANTVIVGVVGRELGIPMDVLEASIRELMPAKVADVNLKALAAGWNA